MCGNDEVFECGPHEYLHRFSTCPCWPSALYLVDLDASKPCQEAFKAITPEDANLLRRSNGLPPLEDSHGLQVDHGLDQIADLEPLDMETQVTGGRPPKADTPARDNAHEAKMKRDKRHEEDKLLIKTRQKETFERWENKRLLRMAEIKPPLNRLAKNFIMHRTAISCETQLSKLKKHNTEMLEELQREILRENLDKPEIKADFDRAVAEAVAKYP